MVFCLGHWLPNWQAPSILLIFISIWTLPWIGPGVLVFMSCPTKEQENSTRTAFTFMVANYCFPNQWPSSSQRSELRKKPQIHFSYVIRPLTVNNLSYSKWKQLLKDLETLAGSASTVSIGECGLDISNKRPHITKQMDYFEKQQNIGRQYEATCGDPLP